MKYAEKSITIFKIQSEPNGREKSEAKKKGTEQYHQHEEITKRMNSTLTSCLDGDLK